MRLSMWPAAACLALTVLGPAAWAQDELGRSQPHPQPQPEGTGVFGVADGDAVGRGRVVLAHRPGEAEKGAFLGLATSPAQPALQKQLQLKPGVGLVVDAVDAGSPAEQAGVKEFDILHKLDDQILVNEEQLAVLVRTYDPGTEVTLAVIREGKPQQLKARLVERELPRLRFLFEERPAGGGYGVIDMPAAAAPGPFVLRRGKLLEADGDVVEMRAPDGGQSLKAARITIEDDGHRMTVSSRDGRKHLRVEDKGGKVLFEGPIETREELERIPADLRQTYTDILLDHAGGVKPPAPVPPPPPLEEKAQ